MENSLQDLLNILQKRAPLLITISELRREFNDETPINWYINNQKITTFERVFIFALDNGLIYFERKQEANSFKELRSSIELKNALNNSGSLFVMISASGLELKNQIELKNAINKFSAFSNEQNAALNATINKFSNATEAQNLKMNETLKKQTVIQENLNKSSNNIELLTIVLIVFASLSLYIGVIPLVNNLLNLNPILTIMVAGLIDVVFVLLIYYFIRKLRDHNKPNFASKKEVEIEAKS